ncbi:Lrp/AsnC family transcriptional regulator [Actinomycetospora chibensis]|uniref:Lrp/AsnC family transcriptional regulator n=1 Tax=Actinomycetospora chibensis TaxID=663606 RepID=A0ABV9REV4_9PSEU|nr:Lrp/AsnC family transcriptional regulator [Actinomycetospora chibensis]MDD7926737.1 Lrp/AsnC family transcriptional regulator [Actinomycetospora chibensis]
MDEIDRAILDELRRDGRIPNVDLADRVGLTPAPCLRRVRRLEDDGVIIGYRTEIDPAVDGRGFEVLVNIDLVSKHRDDFLAFEEEVSAFDEVVELRRMFGLPDYFVRVATRDLESYEAFVVDRLARTPGLARIDSHLTLKKIK